MHDEPAASGEIPAEQIIAQAYALRAARAEAALAQRTAQERRWRIIFFFTLLALIAAVFFVPAPTLEKKLILVLSGVCAQQHNLVVGGIQLPLCARDTGMYLSLLTTLSVLTLYGRGKAGGLPPWPMLAILVGLVLTMAVDGINSTINEIGMTPWYEPRNDLRAATGMGAGVGLAVTLMLLFNRSLRRDVDETLPVVGQWRELGTIILIDAVLLAAILLDVGFLAWPLALLDVIGVSGTLFVTALTATAVVMNYDGTITRLAHLARPATFALILTGAFLAGMAWLRTALIGG
ncbi:DUF2085 domain-containing protein [Roseiflexus castenholzii]|jgi:uncharacterized membrane protein|uniref:DUF2085 domain-containing protein n=1 Tax=Roseiflexus castenholzii (strain DSM 13941 / HLO8) TaxID=383372 RepID=A7NJZ8_ROSCS|nr:DUF2085 domain-containing protein [Roseiflexus castenholzii]ABU57818.1 conserved hypothetical protein [Roseiflexus castenholzii DSM 13941]